MGGKGIVLLGHGSRDSLWRRPIEQVADRLIRQGLAVRCAYLELEPPDLGAAVAQLVLGGAQNVVIVPMFLGAGKHARDDLPRWIKTLEQAHPTVAFELQRPVGEDPRVLDLLASIAAG
jgi:sirohydrochlorin cobaltochelatase